MKPIWPALAAAVEIEEGHRLAIRAVGLIDGYRRGEVGAEAAFVPDAADEFDVAGPFVELDIAAVDEGLQIKVVCSADAVVVHSLNLSSKRLERNPNFHDMAWFTRYDRTFSIWRDFQALMPFERQMRTNRESNTSKIRNTNWDKETCVEHLSGKDLLYVIF